MVKKPRRSLSPPVTFDDGISYVHAVKKAFSDEPEKHKEFLDLMIEYKALRIDIPTVALRLRQLMKDHLHLYLAFSVFLPRWSQIKISPKAIRELGGPEEPTLHDVILFLIAVKESMTDPQIMLPDVCVFLSHKMKFFRKLKARFKRGKHHVYGSVLEILKTYTEGNKSKDEACKEIVALVRGHEDLVRELSDIFD